MFNVYMYIVYNIYRHLFKNVERRRSSAKKHNVGKQNILSILIGNYLICF